MRFSAWFKYWILLFYRFFTVGVEKGKSERERNKEREARLKARRNSKDKYRVEKKRGKKRRKNGALNPRIFALAIGFAAATFFGIILLPVGLFDYGIKSIKEKKKAKKINTGADNNQKTADSHSGKTSNREERSDMRANTFEGDLESYDNSTLSGESAFNSEASELITEINDAESANDTDITTETRSVREKEKIAEVHIRDEKTPKSKPKNENDRYVRKRLIIEKNESADKVVARRLKIGAYLDVVSESENSTDKEEIKLIFDGETVGYIPKSEALAIITCLELKCKIYAVITDVVCETNAVRYEIEIWFEN